MTEKEKEELDQLLEKIDEFLKLAKKGAPLVTIDTFPIRKRDVKTISSYGLLKKRRRPFHSSASSITIKRERHCHRLKPLVSHM